MGRLIPEPSRNAGRYSNPGARVVGWFGCEVALVGLLRGRFEKGEVARGFGVCGAGVGVPRLRG